MGKAREDGPGAAVRHTDVAVANALTLLGADAPTTPIAFVSMTVERGPTIKLVDAFTDGSTIFVNRLSAKYKRAAKGDALPLAAALAHEAYHVVYGMDEGPAYAEQLRVLRAFGASKKDLRIVERAAKQTATR